MRLLICVLTLLSVAGCDPDTIDLANIPHFRIKGTVDDQNADINYGDTLTFRFQIPDTLMNGTQKVAIQSVQEASIFLTFHRVDTITPRVVLVSNSNWTTVGTISSANIFHHYFSVSNKPYELVAHFKPPSKGLYYVEVVPQAWQLYFNNGGEARLLADFNVPDKHLWLIAPFFGGQAYLNAMAEREAKGFGVYAFRVN